MSNFHYGGQAVIEGVMMRGERSLAIAVRQPNGQIHIHSESFRGRLHTSGWARLPLLRGVVMLADTLVLGVRALLFSADVALGEEDVQFTGPIAWGTMAVSFALAIGLFFVLPLVIVNLIDRYVASSVASNLIEGVIRLGFFLTYVWAVGFIPDVRRVFAYHGAEHKTVNAYEHGAPLERGVVQTFPTAHTRCGTAFLLVVAVVSIVFFVFLGRPHWAIRYASRIVLIPLVAAVSYEWLKFGASHSANAIVSALTRPGLILQRLTTRPPEDSMVDVAIAALRDVLRRDSGVASEAATDSAVLAAET